MPAVQSKSWVFTLNNYDDIELAELRGATTEAKGPSYICWGRRQETQEHHTSKDMWSSQLNELSEESKD